MVIKSHKHAGALSSVRERSTHTELHMHAGFLSRVADDFWNCLNFSNFLWFALFVCFFRVRMWRTHWNRQVRPRQPQRVARAQSGRSAQQNLFALRNSSTLKVCVVLLIHFSYLPSFYLCCFIFVNSWISKYHIMSQAIMMPRRSQMKMKIMFRLKTGKR